MPAVITAPSERERVIDYTWQRAQVAFAAGEDHEAHCLFCLMESLEQMDDAEYDEIYGYGADADL